MVTSMQAKLARVCFEFLPVGVTRLVLNVFRELIGEIPLDYASLGRYQGGLSTWRNYTYRHTSTTTCIAIPHYPSIIPSKHTYT